MPKSLKKVLVPVFHIRAACLLCTEEAALFSLRMLTIKHLVGQKLGQLQGRNPRATLGLAGVPRALPVGCCSLLSPNPPLLGAKRLSQRPHTDTSPLCPGRSQSLLGAGSQHDFQAPEAQSGQCPRRGWSSTTGRGGLPRHLQEETRGDSLHSAPCTAPAAPPWASPSSVSPPRGHTWHLAPAWGLCQCWLLSLQPRQS